MTNVVQLRNSFSLDERIERINKTWKQGTSDYIHSIFATGDELIATQDEHGESLREMAEKLPFDWNTAHRLITIARKLSSVAHGPQVAKLPPSWRTLYELTKLSDDVLIAKLEDGAINPDIRREDVLAMIKATRPTGEKRKKKTKQARGEPKKQDTEQTNVVKRTEAMRMFKLGNDVEALQNTSLGTKREMDALILLKDRRPDIADDLLTRAKAGERVSAVAIITKRKRTPGPSLGEFTAAWSKRNFVSLWLRADRNVREQFIAFLKEQLDARSTSA